MHGHRNLGINTHIMGHINPYKIVHIYVSLRKVTLGPIAEWRVAHLICVPLQRPFFQHPSYLIKGCMNRSGTSILLICLQKLVGIELKIPLRCSHVFSWLYKLRAQGIAHMSRSLLHLAGCLLTVMHVVTTFLNGTLKRKNLYALTSRLLNLQARRLSMQTN